MSYILYYLQLTAGSWSLVFVSWFLATGYLFWRRFL